MINSLSVNKHHHIKLLINGNLKSQQPYKTNNSGFDCVTFKSNIPYTTKANQFPDLKQLSIRGKEEYYCAPVSLANGIVYLQKNGYPNLIETPKNILHLGNSKETKLIHELAQHLKTDSNGTTTNNLCLGIESFLQEKGYSAKKLTYQGIYETDKRFSGNTLAPNLDWIKANLEKKNIVLLNFGVYKKSDGQTYQRQWGHWITAVGHGSDGEKYNPNSLIIQDPYKKQKENSYFNLEKMESGTLKDNPDNNEKALVSEAKNYYKINSAIPYLQKDEVAILNGAIVLEMP